MEWMKEQLREIAAAGLLRSRDPVRRDARGFLLSASLPGKELLDFCSNDYLALSSHPTVIAEAQRAMEECGVGSGAARLMSGDLEVHHLLEEEVAVFKDKEAALTFGSGYLANVGIIPALVGRNDVIFSDRLNHASIHDGCRLSGATTVRFRHNDLNHLTELLEKKRGVNRALLVVESVYSMDGDFAPLRELVELKNRFDCMLLVDEAHATGVFGATCSGRVEEEGVAAGVDVIMGTFGKALGSYGAYAAADHDVVEYLVNRARSFIYSTALPPAVAAASLCAIRLVRRQPELRDDLAARVIFFKDRLAAKGYLQQTGPSQIVPVLIGDSGTALEAAAQLRRQGIYVAAVRPPTVPQGSARLRFSVTRHLSEADLSSGADALLEALS